MNYTDEQKTQIERTFNSFCKTVIRYCAINLYQERDRGMKRYVSLDEIYAEYQEECGASDTAFSPDDIYTVEQAIVTMVRLYGYNNH